MDDKTKQKKLSWMIKKKSIKFEVTDLSLHGLSKVRSHFYSWVWYIDDDDDDNSCNDRLFTQQHYNKKLKKIFKKPTQIKLYQTTKQEKGKFSTMWLSSRQRMDWNNPRPIKLFTVFTEQVRFPKSCSL